MSQESKITEIPPSEVDVFITSSRNIYEKEQPDVAVGRESMSVEDNLRKIASIHHRFPDAAITLVGTRYNYEMFNKVISRIQDKVDFCLVQPQLETVTLANGKIIKSIRLKAIINPEAKFNLDLLVFGSS